MTLNQTWKKLAAYHKRLAEEATSQWHVDMHLAEAHYFERLQERETC